MTIIQLLIYVAIAAIILTGLMKYFFKDDVKSLLTSYIQNFCGSLFLFSGFVKIVDPLGTAYKMEDYFEEFTYTFGDSAFSFIAPIFPFLSEYSIIVSVATIVLELLLGYMLIVGAKPKFTAWAFFLLMLFFTALTGFTYLTGYVPTDANFFNFSAWDSFKESNMRVTDCGCFGDFILLDPRVSFLKDVFLMFPAIFFLVMTKQFHRLFSTNVRMIGVAVVIVGMTIYGISNFAWKLPDFDFRPFKEGNNLRAMKQAENDAAANVEIIALHLKNKETGEVVIVPYEQYMKEYSTNYPKEKFSVLEYEKTKPSIKMTKVSEFNPYDEDENAYGDMIYDSEGTTVMYISYWPEGEYTQQEVLVKDSIYEDAQLIRTNKTTNETDTLTVPKFVGFRTDTIVKSVIAYEDDYRAAFTEKVIPFLQQARNDNNEILGLQGKMSWDEIHAMKDEFGIDFPVYQADDIMLKTIIRSNPGIFVMRDGVVLKKWHIDQLPSYSEAKKEF